MRNSASKLFNLLENLLEWSRMQRGLTIFEPESFFLMAKLSESMALTMESITNKEINFSYEVSENLTVFVDGNMIESIIRNLVTNAIKFTPAKGNIRIIAKSKDENWVEISVIDSGIGMNKEMVDNLFKLDINTNRNGTEGEPSTGLGLLLCKDFVERHGGTLRVDSVEGMGSTICFTLPAKEVNPKS